MEQNIMHFESSIVVHCLACPAIASAISMKIELLANKPLFVEGMEQ